MRVRIKKEKKRKRRKALMRRAEIDAMRRLALFGETKQVKEVG
jgi:hypothetical protein